MSQSADNINDDEGTTPPGMPKGRKNWRYPETQVLLNMAIAKKEHIKGQYKSADAVEKKDKAWEDIVKAVNAVSEFKRDRASCETRLRCFPHTVKKSVQGQMADAKKTGGGPPASAQYNPELIDLVLSWLDITTVEGCGGGGESKMESEDEDLVEMERLAEKEEGEAKRQALHRKIEASKAQLVKDEPQVAPFLLSKRSRPPVPSTSTIVIADSDNDSSNLTPKRCTIRKPRKQNPVNRDLGLCDVSGIVSSIDNLATIMVDVKHAINMAHCDFLGMSRDVTFHNASVGSDEPFEECVADVDVQVNLSMEAACVSSKQNKALGILMKVLEDEFPKLSAASWKTIIRRAMSCKMKELVGEETNFNLFMDTVGDSGQDEVMEFFNSNAPEILKFSPPEVSLKVLILLFHYFVEFDILALPPQRATHLKRSGDLDEVEESKKGKSSRSAETTETTDHGVEASSSTSTKNKDNTDVDETTASIASTEIEMMCMEPLIDTSDTSETTVIKGKKGGKGKGAKNPPKTPKTPRPKRTATKK